jgi:hypothetical protein
MEVKEMKTKRTVQRTNETKTLFFEKINKIGKLLAKLIKRKRKEAQIYNVRDKMGYYSRYK